MFRLIRSALRSAGRGVAHDPEVRKFEERHRRLVQFIRRRLTPDERFGLYLTVGLVLAAFFVYLFFGVVEDLVGQPSLIQSDLNIINLLQVLRNPGFTAVMFFLTYLGQWQVILAGAVCVGVVLAARGRRHDLAVLGVTLVGTEVFVWLVRRVINRPRPTLVNALSPEEGSSFPSGHALVAVVFYGLAAYFVMRYVRGRWRRALVAFTGVVLVLAIGFSRIYLGAHWPSDVFASFAAGAAWLTLLITTLEIRRKFSDAPRPRPIVTGKRYAWLVGAAGAAWAAFAVVFFLSQPRVYAPYLIEEPVLQVSAAEVAGPIFAGLPRDSESITGLAKEPINFVLVGTRAELDGAFAAAGWLPSDRINARSFFRMLFAAAANLDYPQGPGIPTFWNGRPNDFAYEQATVRRTIRQRHHIHIWSTDFAVGDDRRVWLGTAHYDRGIKIATTILIPTHSIDPAVDKERQKVLADLQATGRVESDSEMQMVDPMMGTNEAGDAFFTDGKAAVVFLKGQPVPASP